MASALPVEANRADSDAVICAKHFSMSHRAGHDNGGAGFAQKLSSGELHSISGTHALALILKAKVIEQMED
jgi:hypothetical protein